MSNETRADEATPALPVARVLPLLGLPQLDRPFDYLVKPEHDAAAQPGVRVRIRFNGQLVNGIVLERVKEPAHQGRLTPLKDVISPEIVYPPQLARLVDTLAQYYGGVRSDIIRSAVPTRHARAEKQRLKHHSNDNEPYEPPTWEELGALVTEDIDVSSWNAYAYAQSYIAAVLDGQPARAAWHPTPGENTTLRIAELAASVARAGGGVLIVVPDQRRIDQLDVELRNFVSPRQITTLAAGTGPESRYRRYLDILHGQGRLVIGTRSAVFAPVLNLRLLVVLDDADDNLADPRAPYAHARTVAVTRSQQEGCALLMGSQTRSAEMQQLVDSRWAHNLVATTEALEQRMPVMIASSDSIADPENMSRSRLPAAAFRHARAALRADLPVLVQVPRKGYMPTLSCQRCGTPARCRHCNGPLGIPTSKNPDEPAPPTCRWCGRIDVHHRCHECGSPRIRPTILGTDRTAEEMGLAFRPFPVVMSSGDHIVTEIPTGGRIVVATPGAEPHVEGGYGTTLILDTWVTLGHQDLRADEDALATWAKAVALTRPGVDGGHVIIDADAAVPVVHDLLGWNIVAAAERELADRAAAGLPPATSMAAIDGTARAIDRFAADFRAPEGAELLGPVELPATMRPPAGVEPGTPIRRLLVRVQRSQAAELGARLREAQSVRATNKEPTPVRVIVDPVRFG
ncbi:primosomal protein N' [Corynebacterium sp. H113]|uniref:primosomal protein N' n=1 Tax=Corynebacterium sp. H113 TaxID=3133419 RepID=UPI0030AB0D48